MRTETLILENLIYNDNYSSIVGTFLKPEYFKENADKQVFIEIQNHITEYNSPPSKEVLSVKLNNREDLNETTFKNCEELLKTLKAKTDDEQWLTEETERWAKNQAVYNGIVQSISILEGKDKELSKDAIPEILTEALAISLDKSIGHNYLENGEDRWEFYHKSESKIPFDMVMGDLHMLSKDDFKKRLDKLNIGKLIVKEYPTAGAHVGNFRALIRELKIKKDFVPHVIILDYLNICSSSRVKWAANMNTYIYIKSIAEEVRGLAVECNVPVITSSQLNREGYSSSDPDLSNTSESFGLPATADLMMAIIAKDDGSGVNNQILFKQLKNRYSDISINSKFLVNVVKKKMKLYDIDEDAQPVLANDGSNKYYDKKSDANTGSNPYTLKIKPSKRPDQQFKDWKI